MVAQLFADRFLVLGPDLTVDLATGGPVRLNAVRPGNERGEDATGWLRRCAALFGLRHPNIVPLVDFGAAGRSGYFEAWGCPSRPTGWEARDEPTAAAVSGAVAFLLARGLLPGRVCWANIVALGANPAILPSADAGLTVDPGDESRLESCAADVERLLSACPGARPVRALPVRPGRAQRPPSRIAGESLELTERLSDVLDRGVSGQPRAVRFVIRQGAADDAVVDALARTARLHGYVPVGTAVFQADSLLAEPAGLCRVLGLRHVVLVHSPVSAAVPAGAGLFFLALGLASDRPHVLVRVEHAARFSVPVRTGGHGRPLAVRERSAVYSTAGHDIDRRRRAVADAAVTGRHARAERMLRELLGRCARRDDDATAGEAALALGRLMLVRGRLGDAGPMLERARRHFERARLADDAVRAAIFTGLAWTDEGRFREAEAALRSAAIVAKSRPVPTLLEFATLALARCLFWQRRFSEAWEALHDSARSVSADWPSTGATECARERLEGASPDGASECRTAWLPIGVVDIAVSRACLLSRIALSMGDLAAAGRLAAEARDRAGESGNPTDQSAACYARAAVSAALGDVVAVAGTVREGLEAARRAHAPLRALRLRILMAEGFALAGRDGRERLLVGRLARLDPKRLPKVVAIPLARVTSAAPRSAALPPGVLRFPAVEGTGDSPAGARPGPAGDGAVQAIVELLGVCQAEDDERAAVGRVVEILRQRLRAVSVACIGCGGEVTIPLACDGLAQRVEGIGRRAIDAALVIPPSSTTSGLEGAVPIRFAGSCLGALCCCWAADAPPDWTAASGVLAAAAAAIAPCVRSLLDRQAMPAPAAEPVHGEIIGVSELTERLRREIARAARAPFNVVIEGESGSGKELVAQAIHRFGPRSHRPLCALNCAALPDELAEAELFGHARGAFTGAVVERKGLFEEADHGTLVLDEVGELSGRAQAKLLRAIQEGEVRRVGENFARSVDVRIVAATNRPLRPAVEAGLFRRDLLYRLEVIRIVVPPLRARPEDVPALAAHFWREATSRVESRCTLAPATLAALARYDWPGNVRELQNVMAALAVSAGRRGSVGPDQLPGVIAGRVAAAAPQNLDDARRSFEARFVKAALARAGGRRAQAASDLGVTRQGLAKLMARLGIE